MKQTQKLEREHWNTGTLEHWNTGTQLTHHPVALIITLVIHRPKQQPTHKHSAVLSYYATVPCCLSLRQAQNTDPEPHFTLPVFIYFD